MVEKQGFFRAKKFGESSAHSIAIGDGANDINMMQRASIGVGIFGREGGTAANFSDVVVPNFKALHQLIFWHGRSFGFG